MCCNYSQHAAPFNSPQLPFCFGFHTRERPALPQLSVVALPVAVFESHRTKGSVTLLKIMGCLSFCGLIVLVLSSPPLMGTFYIVFPHRRLRLNPHLCHAEQFPGESSVQVSFSDPHSIICEYNTTVRLPGPVVLLLLTL